MKILAIETSCDETSAAIIDENNGVPFAVSNVVASQIEIHKEFGGVVPEVAARAHIEAVIPVVKEALSAAETGPEGIDWISVTYGPGLIGSLIVGTETAKALALAWDKKILPLNHLEGHLYANFLNNQNPPKFPLVALLVSGGHTLLILMQSDLSYQIIGRTRDDAAGEAFDKAAKILGLGYPGGPVIAKMAEEGDENRFKFPLIDLTEKPERNSEGFLVKPEESLDFSFSGLKTALINETKKVGNLSDKDKKDLAASFQKAVVLNLVQNAKRAAVRFSPKSFILSGGVAANKLLREELGKMAAEKKIDFYIPDFELCTDNAAMIGSAAYFHIKNGAKSNFDFAPDPNLKLS